MWNLIVKFSKINNASDFVNKLNKIDKIEFHINNKTGYDISISGTNEFSKELALELVSECIINIYKTDFFNKTIMLNGLNKECKDALIKALVLFDIESDIYYTLCCIENMNTIIVESVNTFLLGKIKNKWNEFSTITNLNSNHLLNYEVFVEFLKFLINSIQPRLSVINIKCDVNKYLFYDNNNVVVAKDIDLSDEIGLITNLVFLAPKNINIYCINQVSNKTFKTLYYLFDKKINLIV